MRITKPAYYDSFRCIASACPDSCCKEWAVQVDEASAACYRSLPGALGDRLRQVLVEEDGDLILAIENGRCPMWREDGLCRIQAELGEEALCKTCREFPRISHDYGNFLELQLELSCPEAARLILESPPAPPISREVPGGEAPDYDPETMDLLLQSREKALEILSDTEHTIPECLVMLMQYGGNVQHAMDNYEPIYEADLVGLMNDDRYFLKPRNKSIIPLYFLTLEILTDQWRQRLEHPEEAPWDNKIRALGRYLVERYWLQAISDFELERRAKFIVVSCLVVHALGGDTAETAQLFSKEIENNIDNVEQILYDAAYSPALTNRILTELLLG